ncbi:hypothetical protein E6C60_0742 [Paenibacillus algicola]|uniref:HipA-like kinase domain-containing protein n=1 Tax=Paenibacillus algicola TaxID=2565926 RepID=A0A4P8XH31_9BACL|nr:HipA family kinase [Paenibacillus algicola]QCT01463.1 hypothetical protein E6C60_0742 [Paenibacillus algicola]
MLVQRIYVDAFLKQLGQGMSAPLVVLGSDQMRYILKNQRVSLQGQLKVWDCMFLNELLTTMIAEYLHVPTPPAAIAELDKRILENGPTLRFAHRFTEGIHFASLEIPDREENLLENYEQLRAMGKPYVNRTWNSFFSNIINVDDIPKIIAMDLLIGNFDRYNNSGNLIVAQTNEGRMVFSIDHGHAFFGPVWDTNKMAILRSVNTPQFVPHFISGLQQPTQGGWLNGMGRVFRAIQENIDLTNPSDHSFLSVIYEIECLSEATLDGWFSEIPDEWYVDKANQIGLMKHFLLHQKNNLRAIIQQMAEREAFINFRGGMLQWKGLRAGTV